MDFQNKVCGRHHQFLQKFSWFKNIFQNKISYILFLSVEYIQHYFFEYCVGKRNNFIDILSKTRYLYFVRIHKLDFC